MFRSFVNLCSRALGRCPRCMRKAFLAAMGAWVVAFASMAVVGMSWIAAFVMAAALGLTALWLAHVAAFALRTVMAGPRASLINPSLELPARETSAPYSRRQFAVNFLRMAAYAAVATALAARSDSAFAQGRCDCSKCRSDQVCCRTANGYCGCFPQGIRC